MNFQLFGKKQAPTLLLIPGLGVSYEIFEGMNHGQLLVDHPAIMDEQLTYTKQWKTTTICI